MQAELISCLAYSSTLIMEATCSSEKSVDFERTTRGWVIEDKGENPKSYVYVTMPNTIAALTKVSSILDFSKK